MGVAIDTVGSFVTAGATNPKVLAAQTVSPGDSFTVRNFAPPAWGKLEAILAQAAAKTQVRVASPLFHDNVSGITYATSEQPAQFDIPLRVGQPLNPGDTLVVSGGAAAGASGVVALVNYYSDLPGAAARLHMWGDISGNIKSIKSWQVAVTSSATIGTWVDTPINTTDKQFHAGYDYAILGYVTDTALAAIGVKGQETSNLRVCGPGTTETLEISDYFVQQSVASNLPWIPVFNADNAPVFYVSCLANTASVAANIYVIAAELKNTITP